MHYALLRVHWLTKGEGGGFSLNPKRCPFVKGRTSPLEGDAAQDQWIECSDFGGLRMVAEGLQNKDQIRKRVGVNRPNTLR